MMFIWSVLFASRYPPVFSSEKRSSWFFVPALLMYNLLFLLLCSLSLSLYVSLLKIKNMKFSFDQGRDKRGDGEKMEKIENCEGIVEERIDK